MVSSAVLLDLTLSGPEGQNLNRTNFSPLYLRMAKLIPMFSLEKYQYLICGVFNSAITFYLSPSDICGQCQGYKCVDFGPKLCDKVLFDSAFVCAKLQPNVLLLEFFKSDLHSVCECNKFNLMYEVAINLERSHCTFPYFTPAPLYLIIYIF